MTFSALRRRFSRFLKPTLRTGKLRKASPLRLEPLEDRRLFAADIYSGLESLLQMVGPVGLNLALGDITGDGRADLAVGSTYGGAPRVRTFDGATGALLADRIYGDAGSRGGAEIALGDVDGDHKAELIVGSGVGDPNEVRIYDPATGQRLRSLAPFGSFVGCVHVAAGDVTGDGKADVIATPGAGGGASVAIFDGTSGVEVRRFDAGAAGARGGLNVCTADFDRDGKLEIAVGDGYGDGNRVRVYRATGGAALADFVGIDDPNYTGGVAVASGDVNGDGRPDLAAAATFTGGPRATIFDGATLFGGRPARLLGDFYTADPALRGGATIALGDFDGDGGANLLSASNKLPNTSVTIFYNGSPLAFGHFTALTVARIPAELITPANTVPHIADIADRTAAIGSVVGPLVVTIGDAETPASSLTLTATSSNTTLVPASSITLGGSGANRTLTIALPAGKSGASAITLTVGDALGLTASDVFVLTVGSS